MAAVHSDIADVAARAEAVTAMRGSEDFTAVCAAFKRMKNILTQAGEPAAVETPSSVAPHPAQAALQSAAAKVNETFDLLVKSHEYQAALGLIATLRQPIDAFFEQVMVMDPDPYIRNTRLGLLDSLVSTFSTIADFSEIVTAG
jgi:glycyl-tRNA synthetase beta chain